MHFPMPLPAPVIKATLSNNFFDSMSHYCR
jgi:hypothetical protein